MYLPLAEGIAFSQAEIQTDDAQPGFQPETDTVAQFPTLDLFKSGSIDCCLFPEVDAVVEENEGSRHGTQ